MLLRYFSINVLLFFFLGNLKNISTASTWSKEPKNNFDVSEVVVSTNQFKPIHYQGLIFKIIDCSLLSMEEILCNFSVLNNSQLREISLLPQTSSTIDNNGNIVFGKRGYIGTLDNPYSSYFPNQLLIIDKTVLPTGVTIKGELIFPRTTEKVNIRFIELNFQDFKITFK